MVFSSLSVLHETFFVAASDAGFVVEDSERDKTQSSSLTEAQPQIEDSIAVEKASQNQCLCFCCTFSDSPSQPANVKGSKQAYEHASKVLNRGRLYHCSIQPAWYK